MIKITRPRRSILYMPGANIRALDKAKTLSADCLILDLEDAVAPDAKVQARENIRTALESGFGYGNYSSPYLEAGASFGDGKNSMITAHG